MTFAKIFLLVFVFFQAPYLAAESINIYVQKDAFCINSGRNDCRGFKKLNEVFDFINSKYWIGKKNDFEVNVYIEGKYGPFYIDSTLLINEWDVGVLNVVGINNPKIIGGRGLETFPGKSLSIKNIYDEVVNYKHFDLSKWHSFGELSVLGMHHKNFNYPVFLYRNMEPVEIARYPSVGFLKFKSSKIDFSELINKKLSEKKISQECSGSILSGYYGYDWAFMKIPLCKLSDFNKYLNYDFPKDGGGVRAYVENSLTLMKKGDGWVYNTVENTISISDYPGFDPKEYVVSVAEHVLEVKNSKNINIKSVDFSVSRGDGVVISGSNSIRLKNISVSNANGRGVVIHSGYKNGIENSVVKNNGQGGVVLSGGDRVKLTPSSHYVDSSVICDNDYFIKTYRPAVSLSGVGNIISNNHICGGSHSAIVFNGNDHLISFNRISGFLQDTSDAGIIYTGRDWTGRGTKILNNFIVGFPDAGDMHDRRGVYLDDQASGVEIKNNIFLNVKKAVFVGGGRDNLVQGNWFFNSKPSISIDRRGIGVHKEMTMNKNGELQRRLASVPYKSDVYEKYANLKNILDDDLGEPKYNVFSNNIFVGTEGFKYYDGAEAAVKNLGNSYELDASGDKKECLAAFKEHQHHGELAYKKFITCYSELR